MPTLSPQVLESLRKTADEACADQKTGIPGVSVSVVGRDGNELFGYAAGKRGCGSSEAMTTDSTFWIASCTKMIVGVACMQLVEKGTLSLDSSDQLESLVPELKSVQVLQDDGTLVAKNKGITLRMLLTHTAGFGYTFFNEKLRDFSHPVGFDEFSGAKHDMLQPLVHQPGEAWEYGVNIDWAGVALERATGLTLNDYLHEHVFKPLGLDAISMLPTEPMRQRLAYMHQRSGDGSLAHRDHLLRLPLTLDATAQSSSFFNSGGAGCFAKPQNYTQILAALLNDGVSPKTGARILAAATVDEMFRNQIPSFPDFGRKGIPAAKPELTNPIPELFPVPGNAPQGWGLTFMLGNGGVTGRSEQTVFWAGLANCWWWCDRTKGVAGMVATQILPFADLKVLGLWMALEKQVYDGLAAES